VTHITCRLTAKNWDQLRNPTLCNRVWATFTFYIVIDVIVIVVICRSIKTATIQQALPYTELIGYLIRSAILLRHFPDRDIYSAADKGAAYCDERVCLFLCVYLSLRGHIFGTTRPIFTKFFVHVTYTALARSPTGGVVISYVFPVL